MFLKTRKILHNFCYFAHENVFSGILILNKYVSALSRQIIQIPALRNSDL